MTCEFCDLSEYRGKLLEPVKNIDGGKQSFEVCIFDSPEDECQVLEISGVHTDLIFEIKYCPICSRKL